MKRITITLLAASLLMFATPTVFAAGTNPYGISTVDPAGPNEAILVLSKGKKIDKLTFKSLLKVKSSTISIYEPFLKKRQTFTAIPLKTLFDMVGIKGSDQVSTIALNDYIFKATASQFVTAQGLLAVKSNGSRINYDRGGPIRIIFPDSSRWANNLDAWNWSIAAISAK